MHLKSISKFSLFLPVLLMFCLVNGEVTKLTKNTIDDVMAKTGVLFINFYADWCRFSNLLEPIFAEAGEIIKKEFPTPGAVDFVRIDCDAEAALAQRFHISKYPTLKLVVNGQTAKREYRGQRSKDALVAFIRKQLTSPVKEFTSPDELNKAAERSKTAVVGYFHDKNSPEHIDFERIAKQYRDDCQFILALGQSFSENLKFGPNLVFKPQNKLVGESDEAYSAPLNDMTALSNWVQQKCIPLVREITFENAEELTEEGLMFLILFHRPDDEKSLEEFTKVVTTELRGHRASINVLRADGLQFQHPLHHLGKTKNDLPLIAIDSFKHMYLFPKYEDIHVPAKLKQFVDDLHSGKLHREFHYGPDPVKAEIVQQQETDDQGQPKEKQATVPPKSVFKNLQPSDKRYTVLEKTEL